MNIVKEICPNFQRNRTMCHLIRIGFIAMNGQAGVIGSVQTMFVLPSIEALKKREHLFEL